VRISSIGCSHSGHKGEQADRRTSYPSQTPRRQLRQWVDSSAELIIPIHFVLYGHRIPGSGVLNSEPFVLIFCGKTINERNAK
jgi:hypothetical protein